MIHAYRGCFIHTPTYGSIEIIEDGLVGVNTDTGLIVFVENIANVNEADFPPHDLLSSFRGRNRFFCPGFVDAHTHAPQYSYMGIGMHLPLLDWLNTYTFPKESQFSELDYARKIYTSAVTRHVACGTTTCSYFATIHLDATKVLVDIIESIGQRAHVGKVNMDRHAPSNLSESTAQVRQRLFRPPVKVCLNHYLIWIYLNIWIHLNIPEYGHI